MTNTNTRSRKPSRMAKVTGMLLVVALSFSSQAPAAEAFWKRKIKPDWSRVQAVTPGAWIRVLIYKDLAPAEKPMIEGRFHSATAESLTILLEFAGQGRTRTVKKTDVRRVLVFRPVKERYQGKMGAAIGSALAFLVAPRMENRGAQIGSVFLIVGVSTVLGYLVAPKMKGIYNVPRDHQKGQKGGSRSAPDRKSS